MKAIETLEDLQALNGAPPETALRKVATRLTPEYGAWIAVALLHPFKRRTGRN